MVQDIAEIPDQPRRRSPSFYIVLLLLVTPLWSSIPLSWAFVFYSLRSGRIWSFAWQGRTLFTLALCEVFFSIYYYNLSRYISGPSPHGPGNLVELQAAYTRVLKAGLASFPEDGFDEESLDVNRPGSPEEDIIRFKHDDPRAADFRNVLRTWFGRVPWSSIRLQEVHKWLYWSIFNTELPPLETLPHAHRAALDDALDLLQKRIGCTIPEGSAPLIQPMRLTLDKVNVLWRPFTYYAVIGTINLCLRKWYRYKWNTHFGSYDGLEYLLRIPNTWDPLTGARPIVFIHGLGLGLLQYHIVLTHLLSAFPDCPLLVLLQPQISQDIFHPQYLKPMTRHETADRLAGLMGKLGWVTMEGENNEDVKRITASLIGKSKTGVTMLSHSNGSYTHAWMLKGYPEMIARSCFVDPVTFCSWEGDVCYNFIYRPCKSGMELLMRYFVGSEVGVANLLQRHFDWSSNALWYDEIPNARDPSKTFFLVGGKDDIVNAQRVKRYLTSHGVRKGLWFDPNGRHGQALITGGAGHNEILRWLKESEI